VPSCERNSDKSAFIRGSFRRRDAGWGAYKRRSVEAFGDGDRLRRGLFLTMTRTKAKRGSGHRGHRDHRGMEGNKGERKKVGRLRSCPGLSFLRSFCSVATFLSL